jgi:hypothetical protein
MSKKYQVQEIGDKKFTILKAKDRIVTLHDDYIEVSWEYTADVNDDESEVYGKQYHVGTDRTLKKFIEGVTYYRNSRHDIYTVDLAGGTAFIFTEYDKAKKFADVIWNWLYKGIIET